MTPLRQQEKDEAMMDVAKRLATLTTCSWRKVGAVLATRDYSDIIIGYNGPPAGSPYRSLCGQKGACGCTHAEINCLIKPRGAFLYGMTMFVTLAPCSRCASYIINSKAVTRVVYHRSDDASFLVPGWDDGVNMLRDYGIEAVPFGDGACAR